MRNRVNIHKQPMKKARIEIIPMIDTIFFLLVFFMFTSLSMVKMNGLDVSLPKDTNSPDQKPPPQVVVTVDNSGNYYLDKDADRAGRAGSPKCRAGWTPSRTPSSSSTWTSSARPRTSSPSWTPSTPSRFRASPTIPVGVMIATEAVSQNGPPAATPSP